MYMDLNLGQSVAMVANLIRELSDPFGYFRTKYSFESLVMITAEALIMTLSFKMYLW